MRGTGRFSPAEGISTRDLLAVGDAGEIRVRARCDRDELGDLAELLPGHPLDDELVAAELLGDGDDAEVG